MCGTIRIYLEQLKERIAVQWSVKDLGETTHILGINIRRHRSNKKLFISQRSYIQNIIQQLNMTKLYPSFTPVAHGRLTKAETSEQDVELLNIPYRQATGSLIYACYTRPDILFSVSQVYKYNNNYNRSHWTEVKRIIRYLSGTINYGGTKSLKLTGNSDADFASNQSHRSYSGYTMYLGESLISWSQQTVTALSTVEAEYMALVHALKEILYLRSILHELGIIDVSKSTTLYGDNQGAIELALIQVIII